MLPTSTVESLLKAAESRPTVQLGPIVVVGTSEAPERPTTDPLSELEGSVYRRRWDDGVADLALGLGVLLQGALWTAGFMVAAAFVPVLAVPFWKVLRSHYVEPRVGRVVYGCDRLETERKKKLYAFFGASGLLAFTLLAFASDVDFSALAGGFALPESSAVPSLMIAAIAAVLGALIGVPRFLANGAWFALIGFGGTALGLGPGPQFVLGGLGTMGYGLLVFKRFIEANPVITPVDS